MKQTSERLGVKIVGYLKGINTPRAGSSRMPGVHTGRYGTPWETINAKK
jgi:hypothetical protein